MGLIWCIMCIIITLPPILCLQPRKIFVQPNTSVVGGEVQLKEYDLDAVGTIQSFVERDI